MNEQLTYTDLENIVRDLQAKVERGITVEQRLIDTRDELDAELSRFQMMQRYGARALGVQSVEEFGTLTVEHVVEVFNLPRCIMLECTSGQELMALGAFGFEKEMLPEVFCLNGSNFSHDRSEIIRPGHPAFEELRQLNLTEMLLCTFPDRYGRCTGVLIAGHRQEDLRYYEPIHPKLNDAFTLMTRQAGGLLQNFRVNAQLKQEIEERKQVEKALRSSQAELQQAKLELEQRVEARTQDLQIANGQLQQEIEDRKRIEARLEEQAEELIRSNQELEQFAYVASHDLRAPLRNISSFVQLLQMRYEDQLDQDGKDYMDFILSGVKRLNRLINDLLQYSRVNRMYELVENVDFNEVMEEVLQNLSEVIRVEQGQVKIKKLPAFQANHSQMVQLFQNLTGNALKFRREAPPIVRISARRSGECFVFEVADNGIGIDPKYRDKVFSIFQRLHAPDKYDGTGIGLSICKKIVERHKGRIWFESVPGVGTTFFVSLPAEQ